MAIIVMTSFFAADSTNLKDLIPRNPIGERRSYRIGNRAQTMGYWLDIGEFEGNGQLITIHAEKSAEFFGGIFFLNRRSVPITVIETKSKAKHSESYCSINLFIIM